MKISLQFSKNINNCKIILKDSAGKSNYFINLSEIEEGFTETLDVFIMGDSFELMLIPEMINSESLFKGFEAVNLLDRLFKKAISSVISFSNKQFLRVTCTYSITDIKDGDVLKMSAQEYVFGTFDKYDVLELIPMMYSFFEVTHNGSRAELLNAYGTNRKEVISLSRKIALLDFGFYLLITHPIQMFRIRWLTSNFKVRRTLMKFNRMSEEQRKKMQDKTDKFFD